MNGGVDMIETFLKGLLIIFFGFLFRINKKTKNPSNLDKLIKLYQTGGFSETFSKIRIWDTPFQVIEKLVGKKGVIVDLGCGDGLMANYLALSSAERQIIGIELNLSRVQEAQKGVKNVTILQGDILKDNFPKANTILLIHVLHHLSSFDQQALLINKCRNKLKKGGSLIIIEIKEHPVIKFILTWLVDVLIFPILFEHKLFNFKVFYRNEKEWKDFLNDVGFVVKAKSACQGKPFSHLVLRCTIKSIQNAVL